LFVGLYSFQISFKVLLERNRRGVIGASNVVCEQFSGEDVHLVENEVFDERRLAGSTLSTD